MVFVFWDTFEVYIAIKKLRTRAPLSPPPLPKPLVRGHLLWQALVPVCHPLFEEMNELGPRRFRN